MLYCDKKKENTFFSCSGKSPVFLWVERIVLSHTVCNMNVTPISQGADRKGNQRNWFKALWEHTLFLFRPYRSSIQGSAFIRYSNWWWDNWDRKKITPKGETTFSEPGMPSMSTSLNRSSLIPFSFFISSPLHVQAFLQAFRMICFPRPPFRAVSDIQITVECEENRWFVPVFKRCRAH